MASHDLHFAVSQNGVDVPSALHDQSTMPVTPSRQGGNNILGDTLSQSAHPIVCIFHLLFKADCQIAHIIDDLIELHYH